MTPYNGYVGTPAYGEDYFEEDVLQYFIQYSSMENTGFTERFGIPDGLTAAELIENGVNVYAEEMMVLGEQGIKTFKKVLSKPFKLQTDSLLLEDKMEVEEEEVEDTTASSGDPTDDSWMEEGDVIEAGTESEDTAPSGGPTEEGQIY